MERKKKYNFTEAMQRLRKYCAWQERCHQEVRRKLWDWGFDAEDTDKLLVQLISENLLNEERYARAIAGGKFRQKGWGKKKITDSLKQKGISPYLVKASMSEIDEEAYLSKLLSLLEKKRQSLKAESLLIQKQKLARFAIGKGYEPELVWQKISEVLGG